jgi:hypothetical protein
LNFTVQFGADADLEPSALEPTRPAPHGKQLGLAASLAYQHGSVRLLDNGDEMVIVHIDKALVTINHLV